MKNSSRKKHIAFKKEFFALPYTAISIVFVVVPLLILLFYAFTDKYTGAFTLSNFSLFLD